MKKRKVGILGGTFDPIHYGHLQMADAALKQYHLDLCLFIPNGNSPHKNREKITDASDRCKMTELALEAFGNPKFEISYMEVEAEETGYTYRTMEKYAASHPEDEIYFILGGDSIAYFKDWFHPEIICKYATLIAVARDDACDDRLEAYCREIEDLFDAKVLIAKMPLNEASSTEIRHAFASLDKAGNREELQTIISRDLPIAVANYIREKGIYNES